MLNNTQVIISILSTSKNLFTTPFVIILSKFLFPDIQEGEKVHEAAQIEAAAQHRVQWEADVVEAARLTKMGPQQEAFRASVMARRQEEFQALKVPLNLLQTLPAVNPSTLSIVIRNFGRECGMNKCHDA